MIVSLSSKINQVSMEERDAALHDLHGMSNPVEENNGMTKSQKQEMTFALLSLVAELGGEETFGHRKAATMSPAHADHMSLLFLRAENFRTQEAAERMMRFFSFKLETFGEEMLSRGTTFNDLDGDAQEALQKGLVQLLPQRDSAGRPVVMIHALVDSLVPNTTSVASMRAFACFLLTVLEEESNQISGFVATHYGIGQGNATEDRFDHCLKLSRSLPWRLVGRHICREDDWKLASCVEILVQAEEGRDLCRTRFHSGTPAECMHNLMLFGIPREALPIADDGCLSLSSHHEMLAFFRRREESKAQMASTSTAILAPGPMDVLMGRGHQPTSRPGLQRMHELLVHCREKCDDEARTQKIRIARLVLEDMKKLGCRFLVATEGGACMECDDRTALKKISHGFRNMRGKIKNEGNDTGFLKTKESAGGDEKCK